MHGLYDYDRTLPHNAAHPMGMAHPMAHPPPTSESLENHTPLAHSPITEL